MSLRKSPQGSGFIRFVIEATVTRTIQRRACHAQSSASSLQEFRVQALQFAAGVCYGHVPVHTTLGLVQVL
jgi:hypothetical protein